MPTLTESDCSEKTSELLGSSETLDQAAADFGGEEVNEEFTQADDVHVEKVTARMRGRKEMEERRERGAPWLFRQKSLLAWSRADV